LSSFSDTHHLHLEVDVPDGDVLIHAGDFTMFSKSMRAVVDFNDWLGELLTGTKSLSWETMSSFWKYTLRRKIAAEHDASFRAKIQEALDDPTPLIPHADVEAHFAKRRSDALAKVK
jgi:hypothetical protein